MGYARCIVTHTVVLMYIYTLNPSDSTIVNGSIPHVQARKCLIGAGGCRQCNRGSWEYLDELMAPKLHRALTRLRFATFNCVYLSLEYHLLQHSVRLPQSISFNTKSQIYQPSNLPNRRKEHSQLVQDANFVLVRFRLPCHPFQRSNRTDTKTNSTPSNNIRLMPIKDAYSKR